MKWKQLLKLTHQLSLEMDRTSKGAAQLLVRGADSLKRGKTVLHIHERVLRALPFVAHQESLSWFTRSWALLRVTQRRLPPPFIHWLLCTT